MDANEWPEWTDAERWTTDDDQAGDDQAGDDESDRQLDERADVSAWMTAYEEGRVTL